MCIKRLESAIPVDFSNPDRLSVSQSIALAMASTSSTLVAAAFFLAGAGFEMYSKPSRFALAMIER